MKKEPRSETVMKFVVQRGSFSLHPPTYSYRSLRRKNHLLKAKLSLWLPEIVFLNQYPSLTHTVVIFVS